jgi:hypothetical protein
MQIAQRVYSLAQEAKGSALMIGAYNALAGTLYFMGDFESQAKWHLGEIASSQTTVAEAISLAKEMNDMHGLAVALGHAALFAYYEGNPAEVERLASQSIELSTRHHFAHWLPQGEVLRGWARSTSGDTDEGISWIVDGTEDFRATGALRGVPFFLAQGGGRID